MDFSIYFLTYTITVIACRVALVRYRGIYAILIGNSQFPPLVSCGLTLRPRTFRLMWRSSPCSEDGSSSFMWCLRSRTPKRGTYGRSPRPDGSDFTSSSVETAPSAARDTSLFRPHLHSSSSTRPPRRSGCSSVTAPRTLSRPMPAQPSLQWSSSPHRSLPDKKGDS